MVVRELLLRASASPGCPEGRCRATLQNRCIGITADGWCRRRRDGYEPSLSAPNRGGRLIRWLRATERLRPGAAPTSSSSECQGRAGPILSLRALPRIRWLSAITPEIHAGCRFRDHSERSFSASRPLRRARSRRVLARSDQFGTQDAVPAGFGPRSIARSDPTAVEGGFAAGSGPRIDRSQRSLRAEAPDPDRKPPTLNACR